MSVGGGITPLGGSHELENLTECPPAALAAGGE